MTSQIRDKGTESNSSKLEAKRASSGTELKFTENQRYSEFQRGSPIGLWAVCNQKHVSRQGNLKYFNNCKISILINIETKMKLTVVSRGETITESKVWFRLDFIALNLIVHFI